RTDLCKEFAILKRKLRFGAGTGIDPEYGQRRGHAGFPSHKIAACQAKRIVIVPPCGNAPDIRRFRVDAVEPVALQIQMEDLVCGAVAGDEIDVFALRAPDE